ncbi:methyltransferase [Thiopseudomonas alkaliphila]|uniref:prepilin peptidase n=1 Tax=Thiopseudomonas alkaliphila TaxID=1697053 RepID=UPI00069EB75F|nr:A24 family peptidase [Thiopseudomonas alkaliphila]AKX47058.1 methyltransferase [Thiopseudomonas alkaliphila]AKX48709.1 methyltransferase [Thiopseudomonas alkaliphila]AKX53832.1 methyltransferase [Thiopseudomonas alkaliphila]
MSDLLGLLQQELALFIALASLLGLLAGSFINVVVYRLPKMLQADWQQQAKVILAEAQPAVAARPEPDSTSPRFNLLVPRSACPRCQHVIKPWENIPLLSWLALKGKCSGCQQIISKRYPLVELASGILSAVVAWRFGFGLPAMAILLLTWGLLTMSLIDADHQLLPDILVLPLLWLGLLLNTQSMFVSLSDAVLGVAIGYLSLWSIYWLFKLIMGKEGMGYGDFKLLAMLGAWGGWQVLLLTILLSSLVGAILGIIILRLQKEGIEKPIPYGPYLAVAGWIALLWGNQITQAYLEFAGL